jgi:hypothetical protein
MDKVANSITFTESLKCIFNKLWDEEQQRMISFREYRRSLQHQVGTKSLFRISLDRVKNGSFFTFFQLRSTSYAPSKTQKLTKNEPGFYQRAEDSCNKL